MQQLHDALPYAIAMYLDEEAERRAQFEKRVLDRLAEIDVRAASTRS